MLSCALVAFAACSGDGGTAPAKVTTVTVTINQASIQVGGTAQASAVAKDQNGNVMTGKTATWLSLTPNVATVSSTGLVTGVAVGTATIQATIDAVTGTATVQVTAPVGACATGLTTVTLAVGEVKELSAASTQGCIKVPAATTAPADYLVLPANTNSDYPDVLVTYAFKSDEGETVPATNRIPSNDIFSAAGVQSRASVSDLEALQLNFEHRLRLEERRELRIPDAQNSFRAHQRSSGSVRYALAAAVPQVGDRSTFKVPAQDSSCTKFTTITAQVQFVNDKVIIYNDVASPSGGFTATDYQQIGDEFSNLIYPTDTAYFGTPLDLDNNGHIIMLYTPEVNKLTGSNHPSSFIAGFFWAGDLFDPKLPANQGGCPQSNFGELFYLLTPDPTGSINGNVRSTSTVRQGTRGTIAHEFQHMINASERIRSPVPQGFESVWLDEGLAHFAEDAVGRAIRGIGEAEDANFQRNLGGNADDFNAFFFQNFARYRSYLQNPGPYSPISTLADSSLAVRGAIWALLHYAADQYAPGGNVKAFTTGLVHGAAYAQGDTGVVNLLKNAGVAFDPLITGFLIANYADNFGIPNLNPLYTFKVYDMRSNELAIPANSNTYPLKITNISGTNFAQTGLQARSGGGANYFFIARGTGTPARTFRFLNADGQTAASFTGANWILLRTR
jgi:hypothetical protein